MNQNEIVDENLEHHEVIVRLQEFIRNNPHGNIMVVLDDSMNQQVITNGCALCFQTILNYFIQANDLEHIDESRPIDYFGEPEVIHKRQVN